MTHLAIDPGGTVGWALFSPEGEELARGKMPQSLFWHSVHYDARRAPNRIVFNPRGSGLPRAEYLVRDVTVESYFQDPGVKSGGSSGPAQEVIGVVKYLCAQAGIEPRQQRSAILPVAMKHCGYEKPLTKNGNEKHLPDEDSAWLHGMERMIVDGLITPPNDVSATL